MSMSVVKFVRPEDWMLDHIGFHMRLADIDEVWASGNLTPQQAVRDSVNASDYVSVAMIDGTPIAVFGLCVYNLLTSSGVPWFLGTDGVTENYRIVIRKAFELTKEMSRKCNNLVNYVHTENDKSIRLLRVVGFTIDDAVPYGAEKELFHRFHLEK